MTLFKRRGIHTVFDLRQRCASEGRHWIWQGGLSGGRPCAKLKGRLCKGAEITAHALGRLDERQRGQRWFSACGDGMCMSPACLTLGTHSEAHDAARRTGRLTRSADQVAKSLAARRQRADVWPEWMKQWALESEQSSRAVAHALEIADASVIRTWRHAVKRGNELAGPFAQLLRLAA